MSSFSTFSSSVNHELINDNYGDTKSTQLGTGAKQLTLPFVSGTQHDYELIRRPPDQYLAAAGIADTTALSQSREYNLAQIHILLSDDPADLPGGASDSGNIRLANLTQAQLTAQGVSSPPTAGLNPYGIQIASGSYSATNFGTLSSGSYNLYFAAASNSVPSASTVSASGTAASNGVIVPDWPSAPYKFGGANSQQGLQPVGPAGGPFSPAFQGTNASVPPAILLCPPFAVTPLNGYPSGCPSTKPSPDLSPYYVVSGSSTLLSNLGANNLGAAVESNATAAWSLIDGYLRVEYVDSSGVWHPVTKEWLQLGFARGVTPPTSPGTNPITPNAILLLQRPADRLIGSTLPTQAGMTTTGSDTVCSSSSSGKCTSWTVTPPQLADSPAVTAGLTKDWAFGLNPAAGNPAAQSATQLNWYPINFYDAREGEPRDVTTHQSDDTCTTMGVMNAVEIDVGNLAKWLAGTTGTSGSSVDYSQQNGYVLYFSDRRGMLLNPHPPMSPAGGVSARTGDSGLEDVINSDNAADTPTDVTEATQGSSEDVNQNGYIDTFGMNNLGLGQWNSSTNINATMIAAGTPYNPYGTRITSCGTTGRKNWVSGARHVLKLVDGSLGNLPTTPVQITINGVNFYGGFTVASENPVYIQGSYNSSSADSAFKNETASALGADNTSPTHVPAAVIADTVTFLSDNWNDDNSTILSPAQPANPNGNNCPCNRGASANSYYRVAAASGKTLTFPFPSSWETNGNNYPEGTDGGIGNFLRFLEDWQDTPSTMHYAGSMVEMFNSTYNTGMFKCCTYTVYQPPNPRDYYFDSDFTTPQGLPPGTPMFRDVESLGYRQLFTPRTK